MRSPFLILLASTALASPLLERRQQNCPASSCDIKGQESLWPYWSSTDRKYATKPACGAQCNQDAACQSFSYNEGSCRLYQRPVASSATPSSRGTRFFSNKCCVPPAANIPISSPQICDKVGYDKQRPTAYQLDTSGRKTNLEACRGLCSSQAQCKAFAFGKGSCLLYNAPLAGNFNEARGSPYSFYDLGCAGGAPVRASSTASRTISSSSMRSSTIGVSVSTHAGVPSSSAALSSSASASSSSSPLPSATPTSSTTSSETPSPSSEAPTPSATPSPTPIPMTAPSRFKVSFLNQPSTDLLNGMDNRNGGWLASLYDGPSLTFYLHPDGRLITTDDVNIVLVQDDSITDPTTRGLLELAEVQSGDINKIDARFSVIRCKAVDPGPNGVARRLTCWNSARGEQGGDVLMVCPGVLGRTEQYKTVYMGTARRSDCEDSALLITPA